MQGQSEGFQHTEGTGQRGRRQGCAEDGVGIGTFMVVGWLSISRFAPLVSPHQSLQRQLAIGGVTYALAIVAALMPGLLLKLPVGLLRTFLVALVFSILLFPPMFGSIGIVAALIQLASWHVDINGVFLLGLILDAVVFSVLYFAFIRRTMVRG